MRASGRATSIVLSIGLLTACSHAPSPSSSSSSNADAATSNDTLAQRTVERRAVEAVIWGMPVVNYDLMRQALIKAGGAENQIVYWSRLLTWKNQTLTPNPDTVYLMPFFNTKDVGPVVLEIPPADGGTITGNIDDIWQVALEDAGPAGADQGRGGKYLILPPGYAQHIPTGYIPLRSATYGGFALLRSTPSSGSDADVAKAVAYGKRVRLYPLSQAANPPQTTFIDAIDQVFDATIPYDVRFFQSLDRVVQAEPWLDRDRVMIDTLKSIGIEKGKPFDPDQKTQAILTTAARDAGVWLDRGYEALFAPTFFEGTHWALPVSPDVVDGQSNNFPNANVYPVDARGIAYSMGFIGIKHVGTGQYYLVAIKDSRGESFDGAKVYRLQVPPNAPVRQYWSVTVYDRATHAFIRDVDRYSRSSNSPQLQKNADGSVDLYFGPKAPQGHEANWVPTHAGGRWEAMLRVYAPEKSFFDKVWKLPDIEESAER